VVAAFSTTIGAKERVFHMGKTTNVSVRIPEEQHRQLLSLAAEEGVQCSDILKQWIEIGLEMAATNTAEPVAETTTVALPTSGNDRPVIALKASVASLLEEAMKMEDWRSKLLRLIDENGGRPGVFTKGAPQYLRDALQLCESRARQLSEKMKTLRTEIDAGFQSTTEFM
jgi:hypothetical protein